MNISRGEVSEFRIASVVSASGDAILSFGTSGNERTNIRVTDLQISPGATAGTMELFVSSYGTYGQPIKLRIPANQPANYNWVIPYKFSVLASTGDPRRFLASSDAVGTRYVVSGYIEK